MEHICMPIDVFEKLKALHIFRKNTLRWILVEALFEKFLQWATEVVITLHFPTAFFGLLSCAITLSLFGSISSNMQRQQSIRNDPQLPNVCNINVADKMSQTAPAKSTQSTGPKNALGAPIAINSQIPNNHVTFPVYPASVIWNQPTVGNALPTMYNGAHVNYFPHLLIPSTRTLQKIEN